MIVLLSGLGLSLGVPESEEIDVLVNSVSFAGLRWSHFKVRQC